MRCVRFDQTSQAEAQQLEMLVRLLVWFDMALCFLITNQWVIYCKWMSPLPLCRLLTAPDEHEAHAVDVLAPKVMAERPTALARTPHSVPL